MEALFIADMQQDSAPESEKVARETASPKVRNAVVMSVREPSNIAAVGPVRDR